MENKIILVVIQALSYDAAISRMNYLNELSNKDIAELYEVNAEKTCLSKPLCEDMLEGTELYVNAMLNHQVLKRRCEKNVFQLAREHGLKTGAAAYYWVSEAYNNESIHWIDEESKIEDHKQKIDETSNIQYATFYCNSSYRDSDVITDSEYIRKKYDPNLLLVHLMGIEHAIFRYGINSKEYYDKIIEIDNTLELIIPIWLEAGYEVIVTTEYEIEEKDKNKEKKNEVFPVLVIGEKLKESNFGSKIDKVGISDAICDVLNIKKPNKFINCNVNGNIF